MLQVTVFAFPLASVHAGKVGEVEEGRLGDMLVVEERFGVLNGAELGLVNVMLLAHVIVPIDPFGQKAVRAVMVFGAGAQDGQAVQLILVAALGRRSRTKTFRWRPVAGAAISFRC